MTTQEAEAAFKAFKEAKSKVQKLGRYCHKKTKALYVVTGFALAKFEPGTVLVIYERVSDPTPWARRLDNFLQQFELEDQSKIRRVP